MFGYVRIFKPDLKIREFEQYQGVYCSLCRTLGKKYGFVARLTLSYDFTFLALYFMALSEACPSFSNGRCPYNPFKKRLCCGGEQGDEALSYAADIAMLMVHYKLIDSVQDERFWGRAAARVMKKLTSRSFQKAAACRPAEAAQMRQYMERQHALERQQTASVDAAAEPTAELLSFLASETLPPDVPKESARRFGYFLGRFIYLADAAEDLYDDVKTGNYNPYVLTEKLQATSSESDFSNTRAYAAQSLHACVAACIECYEQLPIRRFDGILRNVLFCGMPFVIRQIKTPQKSHASNNKKG